MTYLGTSQQRLFNKALIDRPEGKYVFDHGQPTQIDPLPVMEGTELVIPMVRVGNADPKGVVWATDNQSYYRKKARMNPETWAVVEKEKTAKKAAVKAKKAAEDEKANGEADANGDAKKAEDA